MHAASEVPHFRGPRSADLFLTSTEPGLRTGDRTDSSLLPTLLPRWVISITLFDTRRPPDSQTTRWEATDSSKGGVTAHPGDRLVSVITDYLVIFSRNEKTAQVWANPRPPVYANSGPGSDVITGSIGPYLRKIRPGARDGSSLLGRADDTGGFSYE